MIITYQGENYFKIQSGEQAILIDPVNQRSLRGAAVAVNTLYPSPVARPTEDECFWVDHQGEYEVQGIHIEGWSAGNEGGEEKTIYRIAFEEIVIVAMGHLTKEPSKELQEHAEDADVLILPAGGKPWLPESAAAKFVRQVEPAIIIPSLFKDLKPFLKEFNHGNAASPEEKFVFKKKDLVPHAMTVKWLEVK